MSSSKLGIDTVTNLYQEFYNSSQKVSILYPMETGSDYFSFLEKGIPTGGVRAGAGDFKSEAVRNIAGGEDTLFLLKFSRNCLCSNRSLLSSKL